MDSKELRRELERQQQLLLRERRQRRLQDEHKQVEGEVIEATSVERLQEVTKRPGFLQQQLRTELTPLKRWSVELKLLEREARCFDVEYRKGKRVADARDGFVQDEMGVSPMDVQELLSFSTSTEDWVCRVTCVKTSSNRVLFQASEYVANLQGELEQLLQDSKSANDVVALVWKSLGA